jgi:hypothetical protein
MDNYPEATNWLQWAFGVLVSAYVASFGYTHKQISDARKEARNGDDRLWDEHNKERDKNSDFRTAIAEKVGALPTKQDNQAMEERIMAAIRGRDA